MLASKSPLTHSDSIANSEGAEATEPVAKLGWVLIHQRLISSIQLQSVLAQQIHASKPLGELLLEQSLINEGQLKQALREQYWRRNGYWVI